MSTFVENRPCTKQREQEPPLLSGGLLSGRQAIKKQGLYGTDGMSDSE